ncbi:MAG: DAHL domain-containing protein, partial [Janthinobacterium lividum]
LHQARLDRDVLLAHSGLLQDYDPLNFDLAEMRRAADDLANDKARHDWDPDALTALRMEIDLAEDAVERFKTNNALLINSLAYVDVASTSLRSSDAELKTALAIRKLVNSVLHLVRAPTASNAAQIRTGLAEVDASLAQTPVAADLGLAVATLRQHALLLAEVVPAVDADLRSVFAHSTSHHIRLMREATTARHEAQNRMATQFGMAILVVVAVLLALAIRLGMLLRVTIKRQRRYSSLERTIAQVSTDLIAQPTGSGGKMGAMAKLGEAFGADRALLTLDEPPPVLWHWSKSSPLHDEHWSDTIRAVHEAGTPTDQILRIRDVAKLPPGNLRAALLDAGVVACVGFVLRRENRPCGLFLLQRTQAATDWAPNDGLIRMAADVVGNAVRRQIEERRHAELEQRLVRVRRLEAVGAFASGIAHNFNNVIGAVLGHAEMAEDVLPDGAASQHVQEIRRAGERAQDLVGRILEFGTRRRPNRELVAIDDFVEETTSLLLGSMTASSLVVLPGAARRFVSADSVQLQQVVINLVRNGVQAGTADTPVTIRTAYEHVTVAQALSHGVLAPGQWVRLAVQDQGSGIEAEVLRQMFNPFFTTRPAGTGLGLATAREIVRDHRGTLDVQSKPGHGTTVTVWLPLAETPAEPDALARAGTGQTILVLAATDAVVQRDEEMLAALGYEPVGFTNAEVMLAVVRATPDRFDALLLSAGSTGENSAVLTAMSRVAPTCPVIVASSAIADAATLPGGDAVMMLQRPLRSSSLATALAHCLRKQTASA